MLSLRFDEYTIKVAVATYIKCLSFVELCEQISFQQGAKGDVEAELNVLMTSEMITNALSDYVRVLVLPAIDIINVTVIFAPDGGVGAEVQYEELK